MEPNEQLRRAKVKELRKCLDALTTDGVCPVCGLDLSAFPHSERECRVSNLKGAF